MSILIIGKPNNILTEIIEEVLNISSKFITNIKEALLEIEHQKDIRYSLIIIDINYSLQKLENILLKNNLNIQIISYQINQNIETKINSNIETKIECYNLPYDTKKLKSFLKELVPKQKKILFESNIMSDILKMAKKVATTNAHILLSGNSGTGKELLSQYIHNNSLRNKEKFIKVNCAAIPETLLESELFGHEKGSFTGALNKRIGKFQESTNGTILLDEISEMDIKLQTKLLRVIQENEVDPIGSTKPIKINLRIIATSNKNLEMEIKKGNFREDLFFRLNVINIKLPDLSERKNDIKILSDFFIKKYCQINNLCNKTIDSKTLEEMMSYNWPGNIRELENSIHRAVIMSEGTNIKIKDLGISNIESELSKTDVKSNNKVSV